VDIGKNIQKQESPSIETRLDSLLERPPLEKNKKYSGRYRCSTENPPQGTEKDLFSKALFINFEQETSKRSCERKES
jgi:hypothetical protein